MASRAAVGWRASAAVGFTPRGRVTVCVTVGFKNAAPLLDSWALGTAVGTPQLGYEGWR